MQVEKLPDAPGCWLWTGTTIQSGYGRIRERGKKTQTLAHRVSYELHAEGETVTYMRPAP